MTRILRVLRRHLTRNGRTLAKRLNAIVASNAHADLMRRALR